MEDSPLKGMMDARSIAVFGASESSTSVGAQVFANLVTDGFDGALYPINPKHKKVRGIRCYARVTDVGQDIDLAVICTPARTVPGIIRECGEAGIKNAIVLSAGFGEGGNKGENHEAELRAAAKRAGVRFMGPNCVGPNCLGPWICDLKTHSLAGAPKSWCPNVWGPNAWGPNVSGHGFVT